MIRRYEAIRRNHPELDGGEDLEKRIKDVNSSVQRICKSLVDTATTANTNSGINLIGSINRAFKKAEIIINTSLNLSKTITDKTDEKIEKLFNDGLVNKDSFLCLFNFVNCESLSTLTDSDDDINVLALDEWRSYLTDKKSQKWINDLCNILDKYDYPEVRNTIRNSLNEILTNWHDCIFEIAEYDAEFSIDHIEPDKTNGEWVELFLSTSAEGFSDIESDSFRIEDETLYVVVHYGGL